ncbi:MAG: TetR/AcrR family transcriptional regulator [Bacteroidales bacterium]|nr:TetR/AcrR family transcriptional regulator [Bacteroidales bacterium]
MNTKDLILEEARKVFERFGFNKTSMADIATAARKGRRTLYTYFTSKEEIFRAVIDTEVSKLAEILQQIIAQPLLPEDKFRLYILTRMNAVKTLTPYYDALRQDFMNNLGMIEDLRQQYDELEASMIKTILDEGVEKNHFKIADTDVVARAIVFATKGFELPIYRGDTNYDHNKLIEPLISVLFHGISKEKN